MRLELDLSNVSTVELSLLRVLVTTLTKLQPQQGEHHDYDCDSDDTDCNKSSGGIADGAQLGSVPPELAKAIPGAMTPTKPQQGERHNYDYDCNESSGGIADGAQLGSELAKAKTIPGAMISWDGRIHSASRKLNADGTWKLKRGCDGHLVPRVENELTGGQPQAQVELDGDGVATKIMTKLWNQEVDHEEVGAFVRKWASDSLQAAFKSGGQDAIRDAASTFGV